MAERPERSPVLQAMDRLLAGELSADELRADTSLTTQEKRDVVTLALYSLEYDARRRDARSSRQRRAMRLLRSFLSPEQQRQLRRSGTFLVLGSLGTVYRLHPRMGSAQRLERHGARWHVTHSYCLHDSASDAPDKVRIPTADLSLQHLLLLRADESAFLAAANVTVHDFFWNGRWRQTIRSARAA